MPRHYRSSLALAIPALLLFVGLLAAVFDAHFVAVAPAPVPAPTPSPAVPVPHYTDNKGVLHFGYESRPAETRQFVRSLKRPYLQQAGPEVMRRFRGDQPVFLFRAINEAHLSKYGRPYVVGTQGIGDCVSWGWAHGVDVHLAVKWKLGESAEWDSAATEAIYGGSRVEARGVRYGGWSDGSYGAAAAKWVRDWGICFRKPYPELGLDLTEYSADRAKQWGNYGCGGANDNGRLDSICTKHPIRSVVVIRSFSEAAAAIESGYPVPVCSGRGFSRTRDSQGFARPSGSWSHCMCFVAVRYGDRPGLLCQNSWGPDSVDGPKWPDDQPEGSFWVDASVASSMLAGGDSFSVSGFEGFPWRDLRHDDWVSTEPAKIRAKSQRVVDRSTDHEPNFVLAP